MTKPPNGTVQNSYVIQYIVVQHEKFICTYFHYLYHTTIVFIRINYRIQKCLIWKNLTLEIIKLFVIYILSAWKIQILLTNENILKIIFLHSTLESNIIQKSLKIWKVCSFLQEFFENQCISLFNEIWGYLLECW